ncbi:MAG: collagen binding domain-containing protein [Armatimonadota bacterium]
MMRCDRRRWAGWLAAAWVVVLAAGCGGGGGGGGARTSVFGMVRDSAANDKEVENAKVEIGGASGTTVNRDRANATNPVGSFRFKNPALGANFALVTVSGKEPQKIGFRPAISVGANGELTLYLNIGQIAGRILGTDGKPSASAFVVVEGELGSAFTTTGADGTFFIENIPGGPVRVTASRGPANVALDTTVANGLKEIGDLTLIEDANPDPPGVSRTLVGTITDVADNKPLGGAAVVLLRDDIQVEATTTDADGKYGFVRPVGTYRIKVIAAGYVDFLGEPFALTSANTPPNPPLRKDAALTAR